jgi:hypothetical protein
MQWFLDGESAACHRVGEHILAVLDALRARDPAPARDGAGARATAWLWEVWRMRLDPPADPGELSRYHREREAAGGPRVATLRAVLRAQARSALLFACFAALDESAPPGLFDRRI